MGIDTRIRDKCLQQDLVKRVCVLRMHVEMPKHFSEALQEFCI